MNIVNLTRLIGGELLTNPQISSVESFTFSVKNVVNKSAFIALDADADDVAKAVEKGAYAIIFDSEFEIINQEIAYIKVINLNYAMFRLMRFYVSLNRHKFVFLNEVQRSIFACLHLDGNIFLMPNGLKELFSVCLSAKENAMFLGFDKGMMDKISPDCGLIHPSQDACAIYNGSIFYSSFVCNEIYYQNINFPRIFLNEICGVMDFLNKLSVNFKLGDFKNFGHFEPIFVDKFFNITQYGGSYRAFIIEQNKELFLRAAKFLQENFTQGIRICIPQNADFSVQDAIIYDSEVELKNIGDFHYALVFGVKEKIIDMLNKKPKLNSIFD